MPRTSTSPPPPLTSRARPYDTTRDQRGAAAGVSPGPRVGKVATGFTSAALAALRAYGWQGNVRQLRNEIERALLFTEGPLIDVVDLRVRGAAPATLAERWTELDRTAAEEPPTSIESAERTVLADAPRKSDGNIQAAAQALGISRGTLYRKIEKYGPPRPAK